jgi:hypothetical protein
VDVGQPRKFGCNSSDGKWWNNNNGDRITCCSIPNFILIRLVHVHIVVVVNVVLRFGNVDEKQQQLIDVAADNGDTPNVPSPTAAAAATTTTATVANAVGR